MCLRFVRHFDDFLLYSFIFLIPTEPPPRHVKCAACEPGPSHLQLFLYFSHINCTISLMPLLVHTTPHALGSSPSSLNFALMASIAEAWCLLARLASFTPVPGCLLSPKPDVPSLVRTPTRRVLPVSVLRCRAHFFLSHTPALSLVLRL